MRRRLMSSPWTSETSSKAWVDPLKVAQWLTYLPCDVSLAQWLTYLPFDVSFLLFPS